jgi:ribosome-associated toxin RatA of RatAB toxin-antitoxin module
VKHASQEKLIAASAQECFDAIVDFETYPDWQQAVEECEVLSRDPEGRARRVRTTIDAKVRRVSYTLDYSYDEPHAVRWDFVEGDPKRVEGEFLFDENGDGTTMATYTLRLDAGVWIPGPIAKVLNDQVMKRAVEDLKRRVESE